MKRVVIVGAGIAGLSVAHALARRGARQRGIDVLVADSAERPGGNIQTEQHDGFVCERGPNGFLDSAPATLELVRDLGLETRVQVSDDRARRRFIFRRGRLHEVPGGPVGFLRSGLLSWRGKLRIAGEPWAAARPEGDETIHGFAARRIGREAADVLIDSMVSGVFGGNARALSLRACFPKMWEMETEHGGLFRALLARRKARRASAGPIGSPLGRLTSFRGGTVELIDALARQSGAELRLGARVVSLMNGAQYRVGVEGGQSIDADAVVLASGCAASASIVQSLDAELAGALGQIPSAPMAVVCLGYDEAQLDRPLDGFGFLVPRGEELRLLGALWDSSIYPGRAPAGAALIRVMLGGAHDPAAASLDDDALIAIARQGLADTMGIRIEPAFKRVFKHPLGIPQYVTGHLDRLARIDARLARHPGLSVAGNSFRGIAINNCIAESGPLADTLLRQLAG